MLLYGTLPVKKDTTVLSKGKLFELFIVKINEEQLNIFCFNSISIRELLDSVNIQKYYDFEKVFIFSNILSNNGIFWSLRKSGSFISHMYYSIILYTG